MCGISGWIRLDGIELHDLVQMNRRVAHRGRDGEGYWLWDGRSQTGKFINGENVDKMSGRGIIGLGHRRLAILDLSSRGLQPMASNGRRVWVVYNGEIYNYLELRNELTQKGYEFHTGTDTEVILASYDCWGTKCFERFNGMWGLAIVDLRRKVIVLSRDRIGIKPLYVWSGEQALAFASEIKQFFALPDIVAKANMEAIVEYIDTGHEMPPTTFFQNIQAFPPGCWTEISIEKPCNPSPHPFWFPENIRMLNPSLKEARAFTHYLFEDSIKLRLRSDVPVGVCLSGGLDSSVIFGHMHRLLTKNGTAVHAFSAVYEDKRFDEREYIEPVLQAYGVEGHYAFPSSQTFVDDFDHFIYHHDEPPGSLSQFAAWSVMKLVQNHQVPVLLNGQGGDELFSGYWHAYYLFLRKNLLSSPFKVAGHLLGALFPGGNPLLIWQLLPHLQKYHSRKRQNNRSILLPRYQSIGRDSSRSWAISAQKLDSAQYRLCEICRVHLPRLTKWDDRNSMAFSIEARYPFLDYRLVEWAMALPTEMNLKRGWNKLLIREALGEVLPSCVQWRRSKIGFETPQSEWIRKDLHSVMNKWACSPSERLREIVCKSKLKRLADEIVNSDKIHKTDERQLLLMRLLFLDRWLKVFDVSLS